MALVSNLRASSGRFGGLARPKGSSVLERAPSDAIPIEPSPAGTKAERFPCFDGLRAIAALTVIGVHTAFEGGFTLRNHAFGEYTSRLEIGVEVFFVISGFLLYRPFVAAAMSRRPAPDRWRFWVRRLKRIIPAYWLAFLVATYVLRSDSIGRAWYNPLLYMGFAQIYFPRLAVNGLKQAWSLDVEMTFYLMIPLYAALLGSRWLLGQRDEGGRTPKDQLRVELVGLAALSAISFAWRIPLLIGGGPHARGIFVTGTDWLPAYLDQFALGMLLAVLSTYFEATGQTPRVLWSRGLPWVCWGVALAAFVAVSHIGLPRIPLKSSPVITSLGRQTLYGVFAVLLVAPAVFGPQDHGGIRAFLRWRPMVAVGVVSYGIYLWHEAWMHMFFVWTGDHLFDVHWLLILSIVTALSIGSATASYRLLERPIIRSRFGSRPRAAGEGGAPAPPANPTTAAATGLRPVPA